MEHLVSLRQRALIRSWSRHQEQIQQSNKSIPSTHLPNPAPLWAAAGGTCAPPRTPLTSPKHKQALLILACQSQSHRDWTNRQERDPCPPEEAGKHSQSLGCCAPLLDTITGVKETFSLVGCFRFSNSPELCSPNPFPVFPRTCKTQSHEVALNREEFKTIKALLTLPQSSAGHSFPKYLCPSTSENLRCLVNINVNLHKGEVQCVGQTPGLSTGGARCCCQLTPSSISFGKKHKYKILFSSQSQKHRICIPQPQLRHTQFS